MVSQQEVVEGGGSETTAAQDSAEFSGAWDGFEAEESGQPAEVAGRKDEEAPGAAQGGSEAGQGEAQAGQPAASTPPEADANEASRNELPDDVLANADPRLKARLELLENEARKAQGIARANGGRAAKALTELAKLKESLGNETTAEGETPKQREDRLSELRDTYPEVATPILEEIADLRKQLGTLTTSATARAESDAAEALEGEYGALLEAHPDVPQIIADPAYAAWVKAAPPAIQAIVTANSQAVVNAADTALVFDLFKSRDQQGNPSLEAAKAAEAKRRAAQLDAGRTATGRNPTASSDARPDGGTYDESWDQFDASDKRKAQGRR